MQVRVLLVILLALTAPTALAAGKRKIKFWRGTTEKGTVIEVKLLPAKTRSSMGKRRNDIGAKCKRYLGNYAFWAVVIDNKRGKDVYHFSPTLQPFVVVTEDGEQYKNVDLLSKFLDAIMKDDQNLKDLEKWFESSDVMPGAKVNKIVAVVPPKRKSKIKSIYWGYITRTQLAPVR